MLFRSEIRATPPGGRGPRSRFRLDPPPGRSSEAGRARGVLAVMVSAKRPQIARIEPQIGALADRDDVVDFLGWFVAAGRAAARPLLHEQVAQATPIAIVSSLGTAWPGAIEGSLPLALAGELGLARTAKNRRAIGQWSTS